MKPNGPTYFWLILSVLQGATLAACSDEMSSSTTTDEQTSNPDTDSINDETDQTTDGSDVAPGPVDPQLPPTDPVAMQTWLEAGHYKQWVCETSPTAKTGGAAAIHVHGVSSRVCANVLLAATPAAGVASNFPIGASAVKEVFNADNQLIGTFVEVKTQADSDNGQGWYWYASPETQGQGFAMCTGCHSAAGADSDHPGAGDFVYHQQTDSAQLPPVNDTAAIEGWLQTGQYLDWDCEPAATIKGEGAAGIHAHGKNRICVNQLLSTSEPVAGQWPAGVAAVKELYDSDDVQFGTALYLKTASASAGGNAWYWYESASVAGFGYAGCTGCHSAAGSDTDHPGAGDYVYNRP